MMYEQIIRTKKERLSIKMNISIFFIVMFRERWKTERKKRKKRDFLENHLLQFPETWHKNTLGNK